MTLDEIKRIPELQIDVTPAVEDAFYFLRTIDSKLPDPTDDEPLEEYEARLDAIVDPGIHAANRLNDLPEDEKWQALHEAYRMIDNLKKYGVACAAWT